MRITGSVPQEPKMFDDENHTPAAAHHVTRRSLTYQTFWQLCWFLVTSPCFHFPVSQKSCLASTGSAINLRHQTPNRLTRQGGDWNHWRHRLQMTPRSRKPWTSRMSHLWLAVWRGRSWAVFQAEQVPRVFPRTIWGLVMNRKDMYEYVRWWSCLKQIHRRELIGIN